MKSCPYRTGKYISLRPQTPYDFPCCYPPPPPLPHPENPFPLCPPINCNISNSALFLLLGYLIANNNCGDCY